MNHFDEQALHRINQEKWHPLHFPKEAPDKKSPTFGRSDNHSKPLPGQLYVLYHFLFLQKLKP